MASSLNILRRSKKSKKQNSTAKKQLDQIPPSFYVDAEDALDAGIQLEEKAERFAIGEKAIKYYSLSFQVYQRALQIRNGNDADAAYNAARISYILGTQFFLQPLSLNHLQQSIEFFSKALSLSNPISKEDGWPNAFYLDVQFNLASAQSSLAEQKQRIGEEDGEIQTLLQQAIGNFQNVLQGQEEVLKKQLEQEAENGTAEIERPPLVAQDDEDEEGEGNDQEDGISESSQFVRSEYTTSLITPASALETITTLHATFLVLLESNLQDNDAEQILFLASNNLTRAESIFTTFPDGERRSPENEWNEQVEGLRFAPLEIQVASLSRNVQQAKLEEILAFGQQAIQHSSDLLDRNSAEGDFDMATTNGRANQKIYLQKLEQLGDMLLNFARIILGAIRYQPILSDPSKMQDLVQLAWQLCTQSSKLCLAAIKALDISSSASSSGTGTMSSLAVLGSVHTSNPSMRRRASIFTSLSLVSILRSDDCFTKSGLISGIEEKTSFTLLDNARVYARKALAEVGLTWLLQQSKAGNAISPSRYSIPHGGLDSLGVDVEAVLALFRALIKRMVVMNDENARQSQIEIEMLTGNVQEILLSRKDDIGAVWQDCLGLRYNDGNVNSAPRLLLQVIGEEGEGVFTAQEKEIWSTVEEALRNKVGEN